MKIKIYKQTGEVKGDLALDAGVFGVEYNEPLIHQTLVAQQNNARQGTKSTLTRAEVRGGGAKPWAQKKTGRARQGSTRSPQWKKGGVVFAPKPRDFSQKVNKQMRRLATLSALSAVVAEGRLVVVDSIKVTGKTKEMVKIAEALKFEDINTLMLLTEGDELVVRAAGNLDNLTTLPAEELNVYDLVANAKCIATVDAIKKIEEAYKE